MPDKIVTIRATTLNVVTQLTYAAVVTVAPIKGFTTL